jgi:diguanylate cyclase (GGDEF)-like protein
MSLSDAIAAELRAREQRLRDLATADELTGALNRRAVLESLDAEVSRALRHGRELSLLYLDIDLLKEVNDAQGHAAGDKLLLDVVSVVRRNTRASDRLGRMGGDEFLVILPDTGRTGAEAAAAKLVRLVTEIGHSVSIGAAGSPQTPPNRQKLIDAADAALREAKKSGRRRYAVAG